MIVRLLQKPTESGLKGATGWKTAWGAFEDKNKQGTQRPAHE